MFRRFLVPVLLSLLSPAAFAFTQSGLGTAFGNGVPMGHEWITRLSALELIGGDPVMKPDPNDPRKQWTKGLAKNTNVLLAFPEIVRIKSLPARDSRYESAFKPILDAIIGERWVDIGGFNVANSMVNGKFGIINCHDVVTQEPAEIQYDHFMRRYDDKNAQGGVAAARNSRQRFIDYFVAAATAPRTTMKVWDGGGSTALVEVDRNYFLLGRAMHLLQDSFSSEHTVRVSDDNYERVVQVKSYLCAFGSEQHSHDNDAVTNFTSGDVIWLPSTKGTIGWGSYKPSNMKTTALVATEASKDLWAAFIRTMMLPMDQRANAARNEATTIANNWLRMNDAEALAWYDDEAHRDATYVLAQGQSGKGNDQPTCMKRLGVESGSQSELVTQFETSQRLCIYNILPEPGYSDLWDPSMRMPFNWRWRNALQWEVPPSGFVIPTRPADTGTRVRIRSAENGQFMTAPDGLVQDAWVYCRANVPPLDFIMVGDTGSAVFRLTDAPGLFLSYREATGAVKLFGSPSQAEYRLERVATNTYGIKNLHWNMYMWLSGESPYITRAGNSSNRNAQWVFEGLP